MLRQAVADVSSMHLHVLRRWSEPNVATLRLVACPAGAKSRASPTRVTVRPHSRSPARSPSRHRPAEYQTQSTFAMAPTDAASVAPRPDDVGHIVPADSSRTASTGDADAVSGEAAVGSASTHSGEADGGSEGALQSRSGSPEDDAPAEAAAAHKPRDARRGRHVKFTPRWEQKLSRCPSLGPRCLSLQSYAVGLSHS